MKNCSLLFLQGHKKDRGILIDGQKSRMIYTKKAKNVQDHGSNPSLRLHATRLQIELITNNPEQTFFAFSVHNNPIFHEIP